MHPIKNQKSGIDFNEYDGGGGGGVEEYSKECGGGMMGKEKAHGEYSVVVLVLVLALGHSFGGGDFDDCLGGCMDEVTFHSVSASTKLEK